MKKFEKLILTFVYMLAVFIIYKVYTWPIESADLYWHLRMGLDLIEKGLSPFVDHYSFTYYGHPINYVAWPFQVLVAVFYKYFGGMNGIALLRAILWLIPLPLFHLLGRRKNWNVYFELLGILFYLCIVMWRDEPRPDIATAGFIFLLYLMIWDLKPPLELKKFFPIVILLLVWTNYHISSIFGFVVLGAYFADVLLRMILEKSPKKEQLHMIGLGLFCFSVGFLNHSFAHPVIAQMSVGSEWSKYIVEFLNIPFFAQDLFFRLYWLLLILSVPYLFNQKMFMNLIIIIVLGLKTLQMSRVLPQMVLVTLPCVVSGIQGAFLFFTSKSRFAFISATAIMGGIILFTCDRLRSNLIEHLQELKIAVAEGAVTPKDTSEYIRSVGFKGKIFNHYNYGGYLLFSIAPDVKVFIDGRTNILYPFVHMEKWSTAQQDVDTFKELLKEYDFDLALATPDDRTFETAIDSGEFGIEFVGHGSTLLRRHSAKLPVSSIAFVHPECLKPQFLNDLKSELAKIEQEFPRADRLKEFLKISIEYFSDPNKRSSILNTKTTSLHMGRLLGALAINSGKLDLGVKKYKELYLNRQDRIYLARILCKYRSCDGAEYFLDGFPGANFPNVDYVQAYQILMEIKKKVGLKLISEERISSLKEKIKPLLDENWRFERIDYCEFIAAHKQWH